MTMRQSLRTRALIIVVSTSLMWMNGCSSVGFVPNRGSKTYPPYEGEVTILQTLPSPGTYEVLGVVSVTGRAYANEENMLEAIVERAAEAGANTVVVQGKGVTVRTTTGTQIKMAGTAIFRP